MEKKRIIVIIGATATGKSELAVELAKRLDGEIISGDSMQIYKGMDIGTAKPGQDHRRGVPHHLIDTSPIEREYSVAEFIREATLAVKDITDRGKVPLLAGGTGMYIDLFLSGRMMEEMTEDPELRDQLYKKAKTQGVDALHRQLEAVDPQAAAQIHKNNLKRVVRALEIYYLSGRTKTEHTQQAERATPPFDYTLLYLTCKDREVMYDRINRRVDYMFELGLEQEVQSLYDKGLKQTKTASRGIGYKEFYPYFEGQADLDSVREKIKQNSRNYAKRQLTYFKGMENKKEIEICGEQKTDLSRLIDTAIALMDE